MEEGGYRPVGIEAVLGRKGEAVDPVKVAVAAGPNQLLDGGNDGRIR
jgi:hypothetical protein